MGDPIAPHRGRGRIEPRYARIHAAVTTVHDLREPQRNALWRCAGRRRSSRCSSRTQRPHRDRRPFAPRPRNVSTSSAMVAATPPAARVPQAARPNGTRRPPPGLRPLSTGAHQRASLHAPRSPNVVADVEARVQAGTPALLVGTAAAGSGDVEAGRGDLRYAPAASAGARRSGGDELERGVADGVGSSRQGQISGRRKPGSFSALSPCLTEPRDRCPRTRGHPSARADCGPPGVEAPRADRWPACTRHRVSGTRFGM